MLAFTRFFTFPFIVYILFFRSFGGASMALLSLLDIDVTFLAVLWVFLRFAVKLPVYGLHYWLPIAHVEAPTFGSMVLAGLLLKIGGCGLLRFSYFMSVHLDSLLSTVFSYMVLSVVVSSVVCCVQADFKRLVAYSSVVHMTLAGVSLLLVNRLSAKVGLMLLVYHGVASPMLFYLVGVIYSFYSTRLLVLVRGVLHFSPFVVLSCLFAFTYSLPTPPFPTFLSEVLLFVAARYVGGLVVLVFAVVVFLSLVYNLYWVVSICFSRSSGVSSFGSGALVLGRVYLVLRVYIAVMLVSIWFSWIF